MNHSDKPYEGKPDPRADTHVKEGPVTQDPYRQALQLADGYLDRTLAAEARLEAVQVKVEECLRKEYALEQELSSSRDAYDELKTKITALKDSCLEIAELIDTNF